MNYCLWLPFHFGVTALSYFSSLVHLSPPGYPSFFELVLQGTTTTPLSSSSALSGLQGPLSFSALSCFRFQWLELCQPVAFLSEGTGMPLIPADLLFSSSSCFPRRSMGQARMQSSTTRVCQLRWEGQYHPTSQIGVWGTETNCAER